MAFNFKMPYEKKVLPQRELGIYIHIPFCLSLIHISEPTRP